jgi:hypothetical protein
MIFSKQGQVSMKRVAIYVRVSTSKQDTDNQRREWQYFQQQWHPGWGGERRGNLRLTGKNSTI